MQFIFDLSRRFSFIWSSIYLNLFLVLFRFFTLSVFVPFLLSPKENFIQLFQLFGMKLKDKKTFKNIFFIWCKIEMYFPAIIDFNPILDEIKFFPKFYLLLGTSAHECFIFLLHIRYKFIKNLLFTALKIWWLKNLRKVLLNY